MLAAGKKGTAFVSGLAVIGLALTACSATVDAVGSGTTSAPTCAPNASEKAAFIGYNNSLVFTGPDKLAPGTYANTGVEVAHGCVVTPLPVSWGGSSQMILGGIFAQNGVDPQVEVAATFAPPAPFPSSEVVTLQANYGQDTNPSAGCVGPGGQDLLYTRCSAQPPSGSPNFTYTVSNAPVTIRFNNNTNRSSSTNKSNSQESGGSIGLVDLDFTYMDKNVPPLLRDPSAGAGGELTPGSSVPSIGMGQSGLLGGYLPTKVLDGNGNWVTTLTATFQFLDGPHQGQQFAWSDVVFIGDDGSYYVGTSLPVYYDTFKSIQGDFPYVGHSLEQNPNYSGSGAYLWDITIGMCDGPSQPNCTNPPAPS